MKSISSFVLALPVAALCGFGCKSAQVVSERDYSAAASKPVTVYVSDFELGAQTIKPEEGVLAGSRVRSLTDNLMGKSEDPAARAGDRGFDGQVSRPAAWQRGRARLSPAARHAASGPGMAGARGLY